MGIIDILVHYRDAFQSGLEVTIKLSMVIWVTGLLAGGIVGVLAYRYPQSVGITLRCSAFFVSSIPLLVLLYWAHYPLQTLLGVVIEPFFTAAGVLALLNTIIVAEIWRSALNDLQDEFITAAKVCGLSTLQSLRFVQAPLVFRQTLPMLLATQVLMLQMTLFTSLISVEELFRTAQRINSVIYKPIEIYTTLALFFILICLPAYGLAYWLRIKFTRNISEQ